MAVRLLGVENVVPCHSLQCGTSIDTIRVMARVDKLIVAMENAPQNVAFKDLRRVCVHFFGEPRQAGTSHAVFSTP